jgi:putative protease
MLKKPELLAPAGNWESFVAAVENGADAVYLGGKAFSARQQAGNFDEVELARAVDYAHARGVKVYVTVNTLLGDEELSEAARFLHFLQKTGVDSAIVQDLGLVRLARRVIPELPLHASTQMTVHSLPAVQFLKEAGVERVVLARELSLEAISNIVQRSGVAVEVFVHGALCVCYSGQCLMSSLIGGRSGNRGRCAQPCRLNYTLVDERGQALADPAETGEYILSPRDLNMSARIPDLVRSGIASLKIEGRMKRPEYVATVIRVYRALIDRSAEEGFAVTSAEARDLAQIFNRDFTTGYFYGRPGRDLMSCKRPNNRGVRLGRVKNLDWDRKLTRIVLEEPLRVGDGIEVWVTEGGRSGTEVRRISMDGREVEQAPAGAEVLLEIPGKVRPGDRVFKTHDAGLVERARATYSSSRTTRKTPVHFVVRAAPGKKMEIEARDSDGLVVKAETMVEGKVAEKRPLSGEFLREQLNRLGNSPYGLAGLTCEIDGAVMVPVSEINEARRAVLEKLTELRLQVARRGGPVPDELFRKRLKGGGNGQGRAEGGRNSLPLLAVSVAGPASVLAAARAGADIIYFGGEQFRSKEAFSPDDIRAAAEACAGRGVQLVLSSPRIQQEGELDSFCRFLEGAGEWPLAGLLAGNLGLIRKAGELSALPVTADFPLNVFNREAAAFLAEAGVERVTLSPELTLEQVRSLAPSLPVAAEALAHGAVELMVSEYCAVGGLLGDAPGRCAAPCRGRRCGLKDRKGVVFPVEVDRHCRMHIFNSVDLCMLQEVDSLAGAGLSVLRIEARREGPEYAEAVVRAYRAALDQLHGRNRNSLPACDALARFSPAGFTRGHYFRGVL